MTEPLDNRWQWTGRDDPFVTFHGETLDAGDPLFGALTRAQLDNVRAFTAAHGVDVDDVAAITVDGDRVEFVVYLTNDDGHRYIDESGDVATVTLNVRRLIETPAWWTPGRWPLVLVLAATLTDGHSYAAHAGLARYRVTSPRSDRHRGLTVDEIRRTPALGELPGEVVERLELEARPCLAGRRN